MSQSNITDYGHYKHASAFESKEGDKHTNTNSFIEISHDPHSEQLVTQECVHIFVVQVLDCSF